MERKYVICAGAILFFYVLYVFTVMKVAVFWDVAPCGLVDTGRLCALMMERKVPLKHKSVSTSLHDARSMAAIFIPATVKA
jgi:hypothetical protein